MEVEKRGPRKSWKKILGLFEYKKCGLGNSEKIHAYETGGTKEKLSDEKRDRHLWEIILKV
jgi:hypothetical protein